MSLAEKPILGPSSTVLEVLRDATFSEPKSFKKPNGQEIVTRLVVEGAGMMGLSDRTENQEWAGIFNHFAKTAGASLLLGRLLKLNGQDVDLQLMLDTVMLSHSGRRQYDEATWYPDEIEDATKRVELGDTRIGLASLEGKGLSPQLLEMISVHAIGSLYPFEAIDTWNKKVPLYLDFRISQSTMSLEQRFIDLQRGVVTGRYTQEFLDRTHQWARETEVELFSALNLSSYQELTQNPQNLQARIQTAMRLNRFTFQDTAAFLDLSEDELLERLQLHPEDINDQLLQPERWERYVRRLYVNDAEEVIFARLSELYTALRNEDEVGSGIVLQGISDRIDREFPPNSWWGKYVRELYEQRKGHPLNPRLNKQRGVARTIEFYQRMEQDWQNWVDQKSTTT